MIIFFSAIVSVAYSQDLIKHIPTNANMVLEFNVANLKESLPFSEIEKLEITQKFFEGISKELGGEKRSFEELGIDMDRSQYFFSRQKENTIEWVYLLPLKEEKFIEDLMIKNNIEFTQKSNYKVSSDNMFSWTKDVFCFVLAQDLVNNLSTVTPSNTYVNPSAGSISKVKSFKKKRVKDAIFSVWVDDVSEALRPFYGMIPQSEMEMLDVVDRFYSGYESFRLSLTVDEKATELTASVGFDKEMAKLYKSMYKHTFNQDMFNYVDLKNSLGYITYNVNTENVLKEYPNYIQKVLLANGQGGTYSEEMKFSLTLLSTLLDEEAIGEMVEGDMLFSISGISKKEIPYTTYKYDSNYNYVEYDTVRIETIPDFILMATTEEGRLTEQLVSVLLKNNIIEQVGGFYQITEQSSLPIPVYFMFKNDVFILGTSEPQMRAISSGTYTSNVPAEHRSLISKNVFVVYGGLSKAKDVLKNGDDELANYMTELEQTFKMVPDISVFAGGMKKRTTSGTMQITTPSGYKNGLAYLIDLIEELSR